jgi:MYXO-CTERM domain-containing protein
MKKLMPVLALLISAYGALGQAVVNFNNANLMPPPDRLVREADMMTPLTGTHCAAQLLYGTDPASLIPHTHLAYFRIPTTVSPGTWLGGTRTLTGFPAPPQPGPSSGPIIWLQVRIWDSGPGRTLTFDEARGGAGSGQWGTSQIFSYQQKLSEPPDAANDTKMANFVGFTCGCTVVPEPAVIGLGLIGVGALFLLRRRKA